MAYMCADSGNLMAIAQQVIQQQQQQRQQQPQPQQISNLSPFSSSSSNPPPWGPAAATAMEPHHPHHDHHFPFTAFSDPFSADAAGLAFPPPPGHLDHAPFRLSDFGGASSSAAALPAEFDSDEWMESFIGESTAESPVLIAGAELPPIFAEPFPSAVAPPSTSELDHLLFSEPSKIPVPAPPPPLQLLSFDPPAPSSPKPKKDGASTRLYPDPEPHRPFPPLLQTLVDCARIAESDPDLAAISLSKIRDSATALGDPTERVAFYFAEALSFRLAASSPPSPSAPDSSPEDFAVCYKVLNDACPYSKFSHLTANQAILEATEPANRIHIVDFGIVQGIQWAALLQAFATRPAGKPTRVRISGLPSPLLGAAPAASLAATGARLRDFAALLGLDFEFVPVLTPVHELAESDLPVEPGESVAVNFMLQLHHLLDDAREAVERVLRLAKSLNPKVVTLGEHEAAAGLSRGGFGSRFAASLGYYAAVFESLEPAMGRGSAERARAERVVFGPRIMGAVVGAGERTDRMGDREEWRAVMEGSGMEAVGPSNYAVSQAQLLLWNYDYSTKYSLVEAPPGFLSLAWEGRPLLTVSAWR